MPIELPKKEQSPEDGFREVIDDVIDICSALSVLCDGQIESLVSVCKLARDNDSQLKFLMNTTTLLRSARKT